MVSLWHNFKSNIKKYHRRLCILLGVAVFFLILFSLTKICGGKSLCLFYNIFKVKCIGCGMTRAFISILHFDFIAAVNYNRLSVPLFFSIVFYCILFIVDILFSKEFVIKFEKILSQKYMYPVYFILFFVSIILKYF